MKIWGRHYRVYHRTAVHYSPYWQKLDALSYGGLQYSVGHNDYIGDVGGEHGLHFWGRKKKQSIRDRVWACLWALIAQATHKPRGTETGEEGTSKSTWLLTAEFKRENCWWTPPKCIKLFIVVCLFACFCWRGSNHRRIHFLQNLERNYVTMRWVII